jgi:predicted transcriptional regulator
MTIQLATDLERELTERADELGIAPEELVRRAVNWFLHVEQDLSAEIQDWQRMTWSSWNSVEESLK